MSPELLLGGDGLMRSAMFDERRAGQLPRREFGNGVVGRGATRAETAVSPEFLLQKCHFDKRIKSAHDLALARYLTICCHEVVVMYASDDASLLFRGEEIAIKAAVAGVGTSAVFGDEIVHLGQREMQQTGGR